MATGFRIDLEDARSDIIALIETVQKLEHDLKVTLVTIQVALHKVCKEAIHAQENSGDTGGARSVDGGK